MARLHNGPGHLVTKDYEVQRSAHFEVVLGISKISGGTENDLTFMVESFTLPQVGNEPIELSYGNRKVKIAGQATYEGGELTIRDSITKDTEKAINTWQKKVYDPSSDNVGWAEDYKVTAKAYQYAPDGSVSRSWSLFGVWPQSVNYGELSYENNEKKTIQLTLSYDYATRD